MCQFESFFASGTTIKISRILVQRYIGFLVVRPAAIP
jgi:hypothetical protein